MANMIQAAGIPSLTIAGRTFTDLTNLVVLTGFVNGTTTTNCALRKQGGTSGYQVPASKTFKIAAIVVEALQSAAGNNSLVYLCYADNDVGISTATAFTNQVFMGGAAAAGVIGSAANPATSSQFQAAVQFDVPTGKYVSVQAASSALPSAVVRVYGYEV